MGYMGGQGADTGYMGALGGTWGPGAGHIGARGYMGARGQIWGTWEG